MISVFSCFMLLEIKKDLGNVLFTYGKEGKFYVRN